MSKRQICGVVLFSLAVGLYAFDAIDFTFSFGSIGGIGRLTESSDIDGGGTASVFDARFCHQKSKLGFDFSPFAITYALDSWEMSVINASLFHETFKIGNYGMFGPFAGIQWLDFQENKPMFNVGLRFRYLNDLEISFYQKEIVYRPPLLFNYITLDLGAFYKKNSYGIFISCKTDISVIIPLILTSISGIAYENTKREYPDFELPPEY